MIVTEVHVYHFRWSGEGDHQVAVDKKTGEVVVRIDPTEFKQQSHHTRGDPSKAERLLGWKREFAFEVCSLVVLDSSLLLVLERAQTTNGALETAIES
jgi:GDP-D-mannose dehydratase